MGSCGCVGRIEFTEFLQFIEKFGLHDRFHSGQHGCDLQAIGDAVIVGDGDVALSCRVEGSVSQNCSDRCSGVDDRNPFACESGQAEGPESFDPFSS